MSSSLSKSEISQRFAEQGLLVLPDVVEEIQQLDNPDDAIKTTVSSYDEGDTISTSELIIPDDTTDPDTELTNGRSISPEEALSQIRENTESAEDLQRIMDRKETLADRYPDICKTLFDRQLPDESNRIEANTEFTISGDISGRSRGTGEFDDFKSLFNNRYDKLVGLFRQRLGQVREISDIYPRQHGGEQITVVGLVWDTNVTENGYRMIDLEDPQTNDLQTVGWSPDSPVVDIFDEVVEDEVIAVRGRLSDDGDIIWGADEAERGRPPIMFPDVPRKRNDTELTRSVKAALISDVHIGSDEFYPSNWNTFVDWIRTSPQIKYLFIAGDIVEGIGVYPDQDEELEILDIYDQYALAGRMIDQIPDNIQVFMSVGNHDRVRLAEPQPKLSEELRQYFPSNVEFVGNPAMVTVNDTDILMYHGMSINALSEAIPNLDPTDPIPVMKMMLKKRHLAPVYGKNVRLAPEEEDYLAIEDVPDVLHCGHVHKYGQGNYNGVKMVNTATWQGQTTFQKSKGISPEVGYWSVLDLSRNEITKHTVDEV